MEDKPRVGIGVMIFKDGKVLLGKRKSSHGQGEWAFPGGHLEYMESFEECARRETKEETDIEIDNIQFLFVTNTKKYAPRHYVHLTVTADWKSGQVVTMEPEKNEGWQWFELDNLPEPIFATCTVSFEAYKTGQKYYDNIPV